MGHSVRFAAFITETPAPRVTRAARVRRAPQPEPDLGQRLMRERADAERDIDDALRRLGWPRD